MVKMINYIGVNSYIFTRFYIKSHKKISQKFAESKKKQYLCIAIEKCAVSSVGRAIDS